MALLSLSRFIAVVIVILFHFWKGSELLKGAPKFLIAGPQMVTFFLVLSGFVLMLAYYEKREFSLKEFYVKRLTRILPVYFLALFLSVAISTFKGSIDPIAISLNILLLQSWFSPYPLTVNEPGWFLSVLMFCYITFPIILLYLKKSLPSPQVVVFASLLLWLITQLILTISLNTYFYKGFPSYSHDLIFYFPLSHFCSFVLGATGGYFFIRTDKLLSFSNVKSMVLILLLCFLVALSIEYEVTINELLKIKLPYSASFYAPIFLLLIVVLHTSGNVITSKPFTNILILLGEISFPMYILQFPIFKILRHLNKQINITHDIFLFIYIPTLIIIGMFIIQVVERPVSSYVKNKFNLYNDY